MEIITLSGGRHGGVIALEDEDELAEIHYVFEVVAGRDVHPIEEDIARDFAQEILEEWHPDR